MPLGAELLWVVMLLGAASGLLLGAENNEELQNDPGKLLGFRKSDIPCGLEGLVQTMQ